VSNFDQRIVSPIRTKDFVIKKGRFINLPPLAFQHAWLVYGESVRPLGSELDPSDPANRRPSPKNGNIGGGARRLSANWPEIWRIGKTGSTQKPANWGPFRCFRGGFSGASTAWLATQC
jgi:hypothetical protein